MTFHKRGKTGFPQPSPERAACLPEKVRVPSAIGLIHFASDGARS